MAALKPLAFYGLEVPANEVAVEADGDIPWPATFRVTMAAIDPNAVVEGDGPKRATLKLIKVGLPIPDMDDDDDDDEDDMDDDDVAEIERRLGLTSDDEEDEEEEDDDDAGPSDPEKSPKARAAAALMKELNPDDEMEDLDVPNGVNGTKSAKGKAKATEKDGLDDDEEDEESELEEYAQEFVICTLDPEKNYQQPLDITINNSSEEIYFKASGPYKIYLTGNFTLPAIEDDDRDDDEERDEEGMDALARLLGARDDDDMDESEEDDEEEDELDDLDDPRVMEMDDEEEEAPKLVKAAEQPKKGKNKRPAEDEEEDADAGDILQKILKPEEPKEKLTKSQKKKLKNNAGDAVPAAAGAEKGKPKEAPKEASKDAPTKDSPANGKKVQFAKNLEQGPTPNKNGTPGKPGTRNVEGVIIDDRKIGEGKQAKKGDRVQLRYIGKTKDGKQFDANKKGRPFSFKLGEGNVIKGWDIGVLGMAVGGERRITIPPKLGYGSKAQPNIPANSELIFDLKLISIN